MVLKFSGTLSKQSNNEKVVFAEAREHGKGEEKEGRFMKQVTFLYIASQWKTLVPNEILAARTFAKIQGGSNMSGTDLYVNKPHCAAAVRP